MQKSILSTVEHSEKVCTMRGGIHQKKYIGEEIEYENEWISWMQSLNSLKEFARIP